VVVEQVATARCKSCRALIAWAKMERSGKASPFEPDPEGEWIIVDGVASHQGKVPEWQPPERSVPRWTSHFARCADAKSWRKK
jgi:hypothetical protein